ncbi:MAG: hypothetical protein U0840_18860 [Gemmataceae bacterium]
MAEREKSGRFTKGNAGGPGNPFAAQVGRYRALMQECVGPEQMRAIVQALIRAAIRGDVAAARLVLQYAMGKPIEVPLPEDGDEDEGHEESAVNKREITEPCPSPVVEEVAEVAEAPAMSDTVNKPEETEEEPAEEETMDDDDGPPEAELEQHWREMLAILAQHGAEVEESIVERRLNAAARARLRVSGDGTLGREGSRAGPAP